MSDTSIERLLVFCYACQCLISAVGTVLTDHQIEKVRKAYENKYAELLQYLKANGIDSPFGICENRLDLAGDGLLCHWKNHVDLISGQKKNIDPACKYCKSYRE